MRQLSPADAGMMHYERPSVHNHFGPLMIYDQSTAPGGKVTFKGVLAEIDKRLPLARNFREKMVKVPLGLDDPYWVEDSAFDLEYHVRHIALPKPGDWRQFCILAARLHARPLDMSRPPWELYVVEGLDNVQAVPDGSFAIILKIHHAAIDGVSGAEMITALHARSPDEEPPRPREVWRPEPDPSPWQLLALAGAHNAKRSVQLAALWARSAPAMLRPQETRRLVRDLGTVPPMPPRTRFNGPVSAHRVVEARRYPLAEVKRIKAAIPGATVNDVALTVVAGAMRNYLAAHDELPEESLVALVPISTRSADAVGTGGNQVDMMRASLRTDVEGPLERLALIRDATRQLKERPDTVSARTQAEMSQLVPGLLVGAALRGVSRILIRTMSSTMGINTTVTNVPGPREPLYFAGARLVRLFATVPVFDGAGLFHQVSSYCDDFVINITADRAMMPDPSFYAACLDESLRALAESVPAAVYPSGAEQQ